MARRAAVFVERLRGQFPKDASAEVFPGFSVIGGGSTPEQKLPTHLVGVTSRRRSAAELESRLREGERGAAVVARIEDDRLVLDLRTVFPDEEPALAEAVISALR